MSHCWPRPHAALAVALLVGLGLGAACGSSRPTGPGSRQSGEPQTAKEKQLREAKAAGEVDGPSPKWGKWRYSGDRDNCYFVVGKKCYRTQATACQAVKCKAPESCKARGAGPATVACGK
jgi:hypothetical protein